MEYGTDFQEGLLVAFAHDSDFFLTTSGKIKVADFDSAPLKVVFGTMLRHKEVFNEAPATGSFENEVMDEIGVIRSGGEDAIVDRLDGNMEAEVKRITGRIMDALLHPDRSGTKYWRSKLPEFVAQQHVYAMPGESMTPLEQARRAREIADEADDIGSDGGLDLITDDNYDVDSEFSGDGTLAKGMRVGTGIWPMDRRMGGGGLLKGQVGAISASSGLGKSTVMTNIAANMSLNGFYSIFLSLEDKVETVRNRYAAICGNFDASYAQDPKPKWPSDIKAAYKEVYSKSSPVYGMCTIVDGTKGMPTCSVIENTVKRWKNMLRDKGVPDEKIVGVFVDYVSRVSHAGLKGIRRDPNSYERELAIMDELTRIAGRQEVILWTALQANRDAVKKNSVDKGGVANSIGALFPCAAAFGLALPKSEAGLTALQNQDYDSRSSSEKRLTRCDRKLRVNVIKMREAATEGEVFYVYQGPSLRIWTNDKEARRAEEWMRANNKAEMYAAMRR